MPVTKRSLWDSVDSLGRPHGHPRVLMTSGKGGVGKSTITAALTHSLVQSDNSVLVADADGSPSALDSFGQPPELRAEALVHNRIFEVSEALHVVLLSTIIGDATDIDDLNRRMDTFLPDTEKTRFLPILRLAAHSEFFGIPAEVKDLAHMLQIMNIVLENRHFVANHTPGTESMESKKLKDFDTLILDTENTNNLMRMLDRLQRLGDSMRNIHESVHEKFLSALKAVFKSQPNLHKYEQSHIGSHPDEFADAADELTDIILGSQSGLIIVTNPGPNETTQTIDEVEKLISFGRAPTHILNNRWPQHERQQQAAQDMEQRLIDGVDAISGGVDIGYSRVDPGMIVPPIPGSASFQEDQRLILDRIGSTFTRVI